jgi:hypothetical protein
MFAPAGVRSLEVWRGGSLAPAKRQFRLTQLLWHKGLVMGSSVGLFWEIYLD